MPLAGVRKRAERRLLGDRVVTNFGVLTASQAIPLAGLAVLNLASAAALGPAGRGVAAFAITAGATGAVVLFLSLHVGVALSVRAGDGAALLRGIALAAVLGGIPMALGTAAIAFMQGGDFWILSGLQGGLTLLGMGAGVLFLYTARCLQALGQAVTFRNLFAFQTLTYVALTLLMIPFGLTATLMIGAWVTGQVAAALVAVGRFLKFAVRTQNARRGATVPLLAPSLAAHIGVTGQQILYRADLLILGMLGSAEAVGIYAVARAIAELIWIPAEAVSLATFDEGEAGASRAERAQRRDTHIATYARVAGFFAVFVIVVAIPLLLAVLPDFSPSLPLLLLLMPGVWYGGQARILLSSYMAADRRRVEMGIGVAAAVASLGYLPAIAIGGRVGAAVASSLLYAVQVPFVRWLGSRRTPG